MTSPVSIQLYFGIFDVEEFTLCDRIHMAEQNRSLDLVGVYVYRINDTRRD